MPVPGPRELGRGVVVLPHDPVPDAWRSAEVIDVHGPAAMQRLHEAWIQRVPVVVRLFVDPQQWRIPESLAIEPWKLDPGLDLPSDRMHHLLWANNYDARNGIAPQWWWARKASRLGAVETPDGEADTTLPDGRAAWIDGGPRSPLPAHILSIHSESVDAGHLRVVPQPVAPSPAIALAADQMGAVAHGVGPARIVAPAGSGKTRVLTERLRYLLGERQLEREIVCAVAYNRRAQEELAQRCVAFRPRVVTLNALGWELLGRPRVLDERETRRLIEGLVPKPTRRANVDPIGPYLEALATVRLGLVDPAEVEDDRDDVPGLAEAFSPYRDGLRERGAVDFDEQIYGAVERLLVDGDFRRQQQARHRHLLVDEFQDLTPAHVLMLRLLAMPALDVFGVGDDDQVIYGHAGADPSFLLNFADLFPLAQSHPLEVNYRCRPAVVDAARSLLSHNRRRIPKTITSHRQPGADSLTIVEHATQTGARELVSLLRTHIDAGTPGSNIAILTRVNSILLAPQVALREAGIATSGGLDERTLERTGVRAALAYLRIAINPDGFAVGDLTEVLRRPSRGLPQWIDKWFRGRTMTVEQLRRIASTLDDPKVATKVEALAADLAQITRVAKRGTTRDILRSIKNDVGLGQAMTLLDASASGSHLDDLEALEQVADLHPDASGFETWLRESLSGPSSTALAMFPPDGDRSDALPEEEDVPQRGTSQASRSQSSRSRSARPEGTAVNEVTLATIHKVKGQEWPVVILFGVNDGLFPHRLADDDEEERRVLHVGITRGIEHVAILTDSAKPSPFIAELDPRFVPEPTPARAGKSPLATAAPASPTRIPGRPSVAERRADKRRGAAPATDTVDLSAVDADLLERLRTWRSSRAKADGVPPYVVMHDKHLQALAAARPRTLASLGKVDGMGPRRIELYADDLLSLFIDDASTTR